VRVAGVARQHILLRHASGQRHVHDVHGQQLGLARVEAALVHVQRGDGLRRDAQRLCGQGAQGGFGVLFGLRGSAARGRRSSDRRSMACGDQAKGDEAKVGFSVG
jgi:hypothetical protein